MKRIFSSKLAGKLLKYALSLLIWIGIWAFISHSKLVSPGLLPPPERVIKAMFEKSVVSIYLFSAVPTTFFWTLSAWLVGLVLSAFLAGLALKNTIISSALDVLFVSGRALPSIIAVPLFAAVLGHERITAAACAIFMVICYSESSFQESLIAIRRSRRALKEALGLSKYQTFIFVLLPGVANAWRAIAVQSLGIALVVTVAGEMILSFKHTVGDDVAQKAWLLQMVDLYAMVGWLIIWALLIKRGTDSLPWALELSGKRNIESIERQVQGQMKKGKTHG